MEEEAEGSDDEEKNKLDQDTYMVSQGRGQTGGGMYCNIHESTNCRADRNHPDVKREQEKKAAQKQSNAALNPVVPAAGALVNRKLPSDYVSWRQGGNRVYFVRKRLAAPVLVSGKISHHKLNIVAQALPDSPLLTGFCRAGSSESDGEGPQFVEAIRKRYDFSIDHRAVEGQEFAPMQTILPVENEEVHEMVYPLRGKLYVHLIEGKNLRQQFDRLLPDQFEQTPEVRCLVSFGEHHAESRYAGKSFSPTFDQTLGQLPLPVLPLLMAASCSEFPIDNSCLSLLCVSAVNMNDPHYQDHLLENSAGPANSPDAWTRQVDTPLRFQFFDYSFATPVYLGEFSVSPSEITALIQSGRRGVFYVRDHNGKTSQVTIQLGMQEDIFDSLQVTISSVAGSSTVLLQDVENSVLKMKVKTSHGGEERGDTNGSATAKARPFPKTNTELIGDKECETDWECEWHQSLSLDTPPDCSWIEEEEEEEEVKEEEEVAEVFKDDEAGQWRRINDRNVRGERVVASEFVDFRNLLSLRGREFQSLPLIVACKFCDSTRECEYCNSKRILIDEGSFAIARLDLKWLPDKADVTPTSGKHKVNSSWDPLRRSESLQHNLSKYVHAQSSVDLNHKRSHDPHDIRILQQVILPLTQHKFISNGWIPCFEVRSLGLTFAGNFVEEVKAGGSKKLLPGDEFLQVGDERCDFYTLEPLLLRLTRKGGKLRVYFRRQLTATMMQATLTVNENVEEEDTREYPFYGYVALKNAEKIYSKPMNWIVRGGNIILEGANYLWTKEELESDEARKRAEEDKVARDRFPSIFWDENNLLPTASEGFMSFINSIQTAPPQESRGGDPNELCGVGIIMKLDSESHMEVVEVLPNSPAYDSKEIRTGDKLIGPALAPPCSLPPHSSL
ncbi:hypothetical protein GUITHDRAFT_139637 [Guillardia theta CCMP2712]|uniref:PDZ domain-containing protein n=1 Tax=Guillardia theta (strain CCMP2712) TaxID=905079 RepID=L1J8R0_GUITC|nr:hypothetical protein GUITHDRAFT_139637 [Guillardia theta CCMP2712]EKX44717.1 hypothetical protein GUITHDRAFT_139637 [Guillardia theta CCMP2712]|eukprot:XP_005831697.1 hypothetical protein GUITHDRAFT_139637 [Guillardia theta CCMP2712]